ncbi:MAG TPA: acylphosphatase [Saprospiraceae bacterium]|nr:acylphosphatase [Saprospiraceae bacterium]
MEYITIEVKGRVQGVAFRYYTQEIAQKLNISGTVQNLPDGRVRIQAAGESNAIHQFIEWCRVGSPASNVEEIRIEFVDPIALPFPFQITR